MTPPPPPKFPTRTRAPGSHNGMGSKWITKKRRHAIYTRDGFRCFWCGADLSDALPRHRGLDHLWPRKRGGSHEDHNLVTSCTPCNSVRSNWKPSQGWLR